MKIKLCDRCGAKLERGKYHDGSLHLSSPNNMKDIGIPTNGIELCDDCYWQYHHAMKFWLSGRDANIVRSTT